MLSTVILISGRGTNMKAIVEAQIPNVQIKAIISNDPEAKGLEYAKQQGIEAVVVNHKEFANRSAFDTALKACIDQFEVDLVILAGFMRILTPDFVQHYRGRLLNIHPSLLPLFKGLHTHERALEAGVKEHGVSVHFVTEDLDGGPIIAQARVPVLEGDDADALAGRVLVQEHQIYPKVVQWFAEGRLKLQDSQVLLDGEAVTF
ncbi:phosphoribosylglycinamide formyltransferase [Candidatus Albibeggiatoa sp. nov. NOAA]|uniref:phosphoribosylglycinamide formyltransferase n=1 Tax=Candidatus Albibeggiatoa sp. nov. NOAA TaxID=3162724 RepID=UPI0033052B31|nr:phosphoribosylglycinamide formyltransferase [Thiotrichaceae bacterium]